MRPELHSFRPSSRRGTRYPRFRPHESSNAVVLTTMRDRQRSGSDSPKKVRRNVMVRRRGYRPAHGGSRALRPYHAMVGYQRMGCSIGIRTPRGTPAQCWWRFFVSKRYKFTYVISNCHQQSKMCEVIFRYRRGRSAGAHSLEDSWPFTRQDNKPITEDRRLLRINNSREYSRTRLTRELTIRDRARTNVVGSPRNENPVRASRCSATPVQQSRET